MKINEAIQKAIEEGWNQPTREDCCIDYFYYSAIFLDPLFWKALGKGLNWGTEIVLIDEKGHPKEWNYYEHCPVCGEVVMGELQECPNDHEYEDAPIISWLYHWHRFIDWLAEGGTIVDFFENFETL